jgi:predicted GH43/DUF377 family glycosyl hydrolase
MRWQKFGLIEHIIDKIQWAKSHAQVPTLLLKKDRLRIYFATRPSPDITLTTYADVDINDFKKILYVHEKPILELGGPGTFDEFGMMPSAIIEKDQKIYLYYSGWSRSIGVPYTNYTGLAISEDGGDNFSRAFEGPVLDRTKFELFSATSPDVYFNGKWHMWYCSGTNWHKIDGKFEHSYDIKYAHSENGYDWVQANRIAIKQDNPFEALTKPTVMKMGDSFHMWYCYRGSHDFRGGENAYKIGYAISKDMMNWERKDTEAGITVSHNGWDSEMVAYPAVIKIQDNYFLFYNGNNFGKEGVGFAKLIL